MAIRNNHWYNLNEQRSYPMTQRQLYLMRVTVSHPVCSQIYVSAGP